MNFYHFGQPSLPPETLSKHISNLQCWVVLLYLRYEHPQPIIQFDMFFCFSVCFGQKFYHPMTITFVKSNLNACDRCWRSPPGPVEFGTCCLSDVLRGALYIPPFGVPFSRISAPSSTVIYILEFLKVPRHGKTLKESKITKETLLNFPFSEWETQCLMFIDPFMV